MRPIRRSGREGPAPAGIKRDLALAALERNIADLLPAASELDGPGDPMARIEAHLMRPRDALKGARSAG